MSNETTQQLCQRWVDMVFMSQELGIWDPDLPAVTRQVAETGVFQMRPPSRRRIAVLRMAWRKKVMQARAQ